MKTSLVVRWEYRLHNQENMVTNINCIWQGWWPLSFQSLLQQLGLITSNNVLWDFPSSVSACFLSFFFASFCTVSSALLCSDFKSSFALIKAEYSKTPRLMRCCRGFSWNHTPMLGHENISRQFIGAWKFGGKCQWSMKFFDKIIGFLPPPPPPPYRALLMTTPLRIECERNW